jgi:hypothetical protein
MMGSGISKHQPSQTRAKSFGDAVGQYPERMREEQPPGYTSGMHQASYDDYNLFLDDFGSSSHFLPPHYDPDQQFSAFSRTPTNPGQRGASKPSSQYPSRFGSLAPDHREHGEPGARPIGDDTSRSQSLRISVVDHNIMKNRLDEFTSVLPSDFVFP